MATWEDLERAAESFFGIGWVVFSAEDAPAERAFLVFGVADGFGAVSTKRGREKVDWWGCHDVAGL